MLKRKGQNIGKECLETETVNSFTNMKRTAVYEGNVWG